MKIVQLIDEDFINYKTPSMLIGFPYCSFKCDQECGKPVCQNGALASAPVTEMLITDIVKRYKNNPITKSIVFQGLEPFDSYDEMFCLVYTIRHIEEIYDDIVIYTGYTEAECAKAGIIEALMHFPNIVIKFGRYIPNNSPHYDEELGVYLASDNQYAKRIS